MKGDLVGLAASRLVKFCDQSVTRLIKIVTTLVEQLLMGIKPSCDSPTAFVTQVPGLLAAFL